MKTLREYIDKLDEISRRDFLKGAGVGAVAGALGSQIIQKNKADNILPLTEQAYYLIGMATRIGGYAHFDPTIKKYDDQTSQAQSEARINLESLPPEVSVKLRDAYNRGWDAGIEIIRHVERGSGANDIKKTAQQVGQYSKPFMDKLVALLKN